VPYLRDGKHWLKDAPPEANPRWLGGVTPERQEFYRSAEWKAAVVAVYARSDAKCEHCSLDARTVERTFGFFDIHHIISFALREFRAEVWNLALLCERCHYWVHSKKNVDRLFLPGRCAPDYWLAEAGATPSLFDLIAMDDAA
jgi:5-methylcytosine-specific restriction endonuclease McrA